MAFNIWERWPWTSFQNLNLDWLMKAVKEAVTSSAAALAKATAVEADVGTYTDQITAANNTANQAMNIARNADDVLFIYSDSENKAVDYKQYTEGVTTYITAPDIFSAVIADHKVPVFMDTNMYFYDMAGYETNPEQPLMVTRVKFVKDGVNRQDIVWIDRSGAITYTTAYRGGGTLVVNITRSSGSGTTTSDTTYAAIESAYENGMTVQCHVVDELNGLEYYAYDCFFTENNNTGDYFGWYSPFDYTNSRFYRAFVREDGLAGISNIPVSGGGGSSIQDIIDTVNDGDTNALLYTAQTLSAAQQAQVKQNLGIGGGGGTSGAVLYDTAQNLTDQQKAQARDNIGADSRPLILNVTDNNGALSVDKTAAEIRANMHNLLLTFGLNEGVTIDSYQIYGSPPKHTIVFSVADPDTTIVTYIEYTVSVYFAGYAPSEAADVPTVTKRVIQHQIGGGSLPDTSNASAGDFLRLDSNKNVVWQAVPAAESNSFGGVT